MITRMFGHESALIFEIPEQYVLFLEWDGFSGYCEWSSLADSASPVRWVDIVCNNPRTC